MESEDRSQKLKVGSQKVDEGKSHEIDFRSQQLEVRPQKAYVTIWESEVRHYKLEEGGQQK